MKEVKIDINDIARGIYGFLLRKNLITPDEYQMLRVSKIKIEEEIRNGNGYIQETSNGNPSGSKKEH